VIHAQLHLNKHIEWHLLKMFVCIFRLSIQSIRIRLSFHTSLVQGHNKQIECIAVSVINENNSVDVSKHQDTLFFQMYSNSK